MTSGSFWYQIYYFKSICSQVTGLNVQQNRGKIRSSLTHFGAVYEIFYPQSHRKVVHCINARARVLLPFHIRGAFPYKGREGGLSEPRARLVKVVQVYCSVYQGRTNLYLQFKTKFVQIHRTVLIL